MGRQLSRSCLGMTCGFMAVLAAAAPLKAELLYVTLQSSVASFELSSGNATAIAASKATVATGLTEAMGIVFGSDGFLYAAQYTPRSVSKINVANGSVTTFATGFTDPRGITSIPTTGGFYVTNSNAPGSVSQVTSGGAVSTFVNSGVNAPYGAAVDGSGALYVSNNAGAFLTKIVAGTPSTFATFTAGLGTRGVAVSASGDIYTAVGNGVKKTTAGGVTTDFVTGGIGFPFGLAWGSEGNLYVASYTDNLVYAYDSTGSPLFSFSTGASSSDRPRFVAFNREGSGFNQVTAVPEPGSLWVIGLGVAVACVAAQRSRLSTR